MVAIVQNAKKEPFGMPTLTPVSSSVVKTLLLTRESTNVFATLDLASSMEFVILVHPTISLIKDTVLHAQLTHTLVPQANVIATKASSLTNLEFVQENVELMKNTTKTLINVFAC